MKKIVSVLIICVMLLSSFGVSAVATSSKVEDTYTQPEKFIYGDVDMDSVVTVKDATLVQKYIAQIETLSLIQKYAAKINDKKISVRNATEIQKYVAGISNNSNVGIMEFMDFPITFEKNMIDASATGDELSFVQTECVNFDSGSETYKYFKNNMFYVFFEANYIFEGLENTELENKYTDEYFENNALIVMSHFGSSSRLYRVDSITQFDGVLGVNYTTLFPKSGVVTTDVVNSLLYIEVSREDIRDVVDIVTYENIGVY